MDGERSERGKDVGTVFVYDRTALHWAAKRNHQQVVEYLLEIGADRSIQAYDASTPAHLCSNESLRRVLDIQSNGGRKTMLIEERGNHWFGYV